MMNKGIIPINKPKSWTSFDVVNKLKPMLKPAKVGHLGTLDPLATGVLLVTVGKATKLFDFMQNKRKTYVATFEFGYSTTTLDTMGEVEQTTKQIPTLEQIESVLPKFEGRINQMPPKFSAKSVNGVRAYDLARKGIDFELKPKLVDIFDLNIISYNQPILMLEICCGSGTYIRSIGRDIAIELNSLATMTDLQRTAIDQFAVTDCEEIENINKENIETKIMPIKQVVNLKEINLNDFEKKLVLNGQQIKTEFEDGLYQIIETDTVAIVEVKNFFAKMLIFLG